MLYSTGTAGRKVINTIKRRKLKNPNRNAKQKLNSNSGNSPRKVNGKRESGRRHIMAEKQQINNY